MKGIHFRMFLCLGLALLAAAAAHGAATIPVYGPARAGVEDWDILQETVLDVGVIAYCPDNDPNELRVGDGVTPGGRVVHMNGTVTSFEQIAAATTNLDMKSFHIAWGPWRAHGDLNALNFTYGANELWMRFVRDTGSAYLPFNLDIQEGGVFRFTVPSAEGTPEPVLQVSTNLVLGFENASAGTFGTSRPDAAHLVISYTNAEASTIFFSVFDAAALETGAYFSVPIVTTNGITLGTNTWHEWPDVATKSELSDATNALAGAVAETYATADNLASVAGLAATNAGNIYSNAAALTTLTNALGQRVSELETVHIGLAPTTQTNEKFWVPTNLPTRSLTLHFNADKYTSTNYAAYVFITNGWRPSKPVTIKIVLDYASTAAVRFRTGIGTSQRTDRAMSSGAIYNYTWIPEGYGQWELLEITTGSTRIYSENGDSGNVGWYMTAQDLPHTIEDWIEWRKQQPW